MDETKGKNKVLLVQAPPWGIRTPPLGIAYLATFLKSFSFSSDILDLNIEIFNRADKKIKEKWHTQDLEFWTSGKAVEWLSTQLEYLADRIISFGAQTIGFSITRASVPLINTLLALIRNKMRDDLIILVGGAGTSYREIRSLCHKDLIDYFIIGEGEYPLVCLLRDLRKKNAIETNPSYIVWKDHSQDKVTCLKAASDNSIKIDEIPFPNFEEFNLDSYTHKDLMPIISSRGCIMSCVFCCDAQLKKPYRSRSPQKIAEEIRHHVGRYNRKKFEFSDLLINGDLNFLDKFCDILIEMDLGVCWGGQATIRRDMDVGLFKKMKKAGCGGLTFGCESFSDHILRLMRKGVISRDAKDTFIKAKEAGMRVEINLIIGFPGETEADVDETIRFIRENAKFFDKINSLNICTISPGMHIYENLYEYNIDKAMIRDWYAWFTRDMSNTLEVRVERHKRVASACSELNLKPAWQNIKR